MDTRPHNLFYPYPRHCCILLRSRDCGFIRRRNAIPLHPQQGTRISFKDFHIRTVSASTISAKVACRSTSNSVGMAAKRRGDLGYQHQVKEHHGVMKDFESDDGLDSRRTESLHFLKLINRSFETGNYDEGLYLLKGMVSAGHSPNVEICTRLINCFSSSTSAMSKAQEVMEILENHGSQDTSAYNSLLRVICWETKASSVEHVLESCLSVLDRMGAHNCTPDNVTYEILIGALSGKGRLDLAMEVLCQLLQDNQCQPTPENYFILIEACIRNDEGKGTAITRIMKLLEEMAARGLQPDNHTYNCIVRKLCEKNVDQAWDLMRILSGSHQTSGTSSSSSGFKPTMVPDVKSYQALMAKMCRTGRLEDAKKLLSEMVSTGPRKPKEATYSFLIKTLCDLGMVDKAVEVLDDMTATGLTPDWYTYQAINWYYCKQGRTDLAITFMERLLSCGYVPHINNYNSILSSLCKRGAAYQLLEVPGKLEKMGYCPNAGTYNAFIAGFWFNKDRTEAMKMLSRMVDKGIHPDEITYKILISGLCRDGMVYHAIQLMKDIPETWKHMPNVTTYNTIIFGLCKARHIDAAIDFFVEMVERGCTPNEYTYIKLVEGLAHAGHQNEATKMHTALLSLNAIQKH